MKNIIKYIFAASVLFYFGCNEADLEHLKIPQPKSGGIVDVVFEPGKGLFDISDISNSQIVYDLIGRDQSGTGDLISGAEIFVYRQSASGVVSDTALFYSYTRGVTSLSTGVSDFIENIGLTIADVGAGDQFKFYMDTVFMKNGDFYTIGNTSDAITINRGDFAWTVFVGCPSWSPEEAAGTYTVITDDWGLHPTDASWEIEVIAGPGENQVTLLDFAQHAVPGNATGQYDVIVTVDPVTSQATSEPQDAWHCDNFGCGYGQGQVAVVDGFWFACAGFVTIPVNVTVSIGGWGVNAFEMQKN